MKVRSFNEGLTIFRRSDAPQKPRTSILLPTFSRAHGLLQESVSSVLSQSDADFELIVIDDGSRDATRDVLDEFQRLDARVVVHRYEANSGLPALRVNQAALASKGQYIAYQFDDDLWTERSLELRLRSLLKADVPSVVYGKALLTGVADGSESAPLVLGGEFDFARLMDGNYIANNSVLHHRELFSVAGLYDPHLIMRRFCDYDLWLRFARVAPFLFVDEIVSVVRANQEGGLGKELPLLFSSYRKVISTDRNDLLKPDRWETYDVLSLDELSDVFSSKEKGAYWRSEVVPFAAVHNDYIGEEEYAVLAGYRAEPLRLLAVKPNYSTSIDVTISNYSSIKSQHAIRSAFVKERDLSAVEASAFDVFVLYRTGAASTSDAMGKWLSGTPTVYLMDDNMLSFYDQGPEFSYLAPGSAMHQEIRYQIQNADSCIAYSDAIWEDMSSLNPRVSRLNTSIPRHHLLRDVSDEDAVVRIAMLSGPARRKILERIWPAIQDFAENNSESVEFHFWGVDPKEFGELPCKVYYRPFTNNYSEYLHALRRQNFNVVMVPLDGTARSARSKSPVKLLEAAVAGAFCIFSDVEPYSNLPDQCCLKVENSVSAWRDALDKALALGSEGRRALAMRAKDHVEEAYTCEGQFYDFLATFEAAKLHFRIQSRVVLYVFHETALGGATLHLLRHASLIRSLGFSVVGLTPQSEAYSESFEERWNAATKCSPLFFGEWRGGYIGSDKHRQTSEKDLIDAKRLAKFLKKEGIDVGLVHFGTYSPTMSFLAKELGVPSVASVHAFYEGANTDIAGFADAVHCSSLTHGAAWAKYSFGSVRRIVCPVDQDYFDLFSVNRRRLAGRCGPARILVSGTLQPRKNQLEAIKATALLKETGVDVTLDLIGYTEFFPDYVLECQETAKRLGIEDSVTFHGFIDDPVPFYGTADILLIAATDESMPQTMLQAMAAGVPVVSTKVGGVAEILRPHFTGMLADTPNADSLSEALGKYLGAGVERQLDIIDRAHRTLRFLGRPSYVRSELVNLYLEAFLNSSASRPDERSASNFAAQGALTDLRTVESAKVCEELYEKWQKLAQSRSIMASRDTADDLLLDSAGISEDFESLRDFSQTKFGVYRRARLTLSENLRAVPYIEYFVPFDMPRLCSITLAVAPLLLARRGFVGVEIVSHDQRILGQSNVRLNEIEKAQPTIFVLPTPVEKLTAGWSFRVYQRDADTPVVLHEIRCRRAGFGKERVVPLVTLE